MATIPASVPREGSRETKQPHPPWVGAIWFGLLLLICYAPTLQRLVHQWANDEDVGHGFFVPVIAGYIAWLKRDELLAHKPSSNVWGLVLVIWGAVQLQVATLG